MEPAIRTFARAVLDLELDARVRQGALDRRADARAIFRVHELEKRRERPVELVERNAEQIGDAARPNHAVGDAVPRPRSIRAASSSSRPSFVTANQDRTMRDAAEPHSGNAAVPASVVASSSFLARDG